MCETINLKTEFLRLRKELGQLLRFARKQEIFSAEQSAQRNGLTGVAELYAFERGEHKNLLKYFEIAESYGMQIHLSMDFSDVLQNKNWHRRRAVYAKQMFQLAWSGILRRQREFHHFSIRELSDKTGIPVARIQALEQDRAAFSLNEACLLMSYFNKELLPETVRAE